MNYFDLLSQKEFNEYTIKHLYIWSQLKGITFCCLIFPFEQIDVYPKKNMTLFFAEKIYKNFEDLLKELKKFKNYDLKQVFFYGCYSEFVDLVNLLNTFPPYRTYPYKYIIRHSDKHFYANHVKSATFRANGEFIKPFINNDIIYNTKKLIDNGNLCAVLESQRILKRISSIEKEFGYDELNFDTFKEINYDIRVLFLGLIDTCFYQPVRKIYNAQWV